MIFLIFCFLQTRDIVKPQLYIKDAIGNYEYEHICAIRARTYLVCTFVEMYALERSNLARLFVGMVFRQNNTKRCTCILNIRSKNMLSVSCTYAGFRANTTLKIITGIKPSTSGFKLLVY